MWLGSCACYTFHSDSSPRIHVPIITNKESFLVFMHSGIHHLEIGKVYWVDTTQIHSAMNGSSEWRLHLVGETN